MSQKNVYFVEECNSIEPHIEMCDLFLFVIFYLLFIFGGFVAITEEE